MELDTLVYLGNMFSQWLNSLNVMFNLDYLTFTDVMFNGATLYDIRGVVTWGFTTAPLTISIPSIPLLSDIGKLLFDLLFYDTRFIHMPFYFCLLICLIRVTIIIWVIDILKKIIKSV